MKMRNILSIEKPRETFARGPVYPVCGNNTNNSNSIGGMEVSDGATTYAINSNSVNKVCLSEILPCTDIAGEETESVRFDGGEAKPTNFVTDAERRVEWDKFYKLAWKFKSRLLKKYHGRIRFPVSDDDIL